MVVTLCFDFGNTRKKVAVFTDGTFMEEVFLEDDNPATIKTLLEKWRPARTILSSVVHHHPELETLLAANGWFHKLNHLSKLNFLTPVGKPETIGADRLVGGV